MACGVIGMLIAIASLAVTVRPTFAGSAAADVSVSSEGGGFAPKLIHADSGNAAKITNARVIMGVSPVYSQAASARQ